LLLMPVFKNLPEAVLAALIIHAVSHLWKVRAFERYFAEQRVEAVLGLVTLIGVITIDVLPGLGVGGLSVLLVVIYHATRPHLGVLGKVPGVPGAYGDLGRHPDYEQVPGLLVLRLESPLFYANASLVGKEIKRLVGASDPLPHGVIVELGANDSLDITSTEMLEQTIAALKAAGITLALADLRQPVRQMPRRTGLLAAASPDHAFH